MPFLIAAWGFLKAVPWQVYAGIAIVVALGAAHLSAVHKAVKANDAKWTEDIRKQNEFYLKRIGEIKAKQQEIVTREITIYRDRVKVVKEKGVEILREVEKLVPADTCELPGGMRIFHDAAATGDVPSDSVGAARAAAGVEAITLATTVAENYGTCRAEFEKLVALQKLVTSLQGVKP